MSKKTNVREMAADALLMIEKNQAYSNLLLNSFIQKHSLAEKDVPLFTELVYGTLQRKDTLDFYLAPFIKKANKMELWVRILLRLSVYQMVYLDRVPERAAVHEAVEIAKRKGHQGIASLVNGILRSIQREGLPSFEDIQDPVQRTAVATSHPLWLVEKWTKQYGLEEAGKMCEENLKAPRQTARINKTKYSVNEAIELLQKEGFSARRGSLSPDSIMMEKGSLASSTLFKDGGATIQDESSSLTAKVLGVQEGESVLDACAAPGGKSSHILELLNHKGQLMSLDLHQHKVELVKEQANRLGFENLTVQDLDARKAGEVFNEESFDRILVDAPCSGFGVIKRKPDIKYAKSARDIQKLAAIQLEILHSVSPLLKKGGTLVYSTCTVDQEENHAVAQQFLQDHPDYEWDETMTGRLPEEARQYAEASELQLLPHYFGTDGFYITSFKRKVSF
ncbi:16S rRNA (cytosine(967)-C(5))-methyltransferase RsmB [Metabacillus sp. GX 13764]|uniref:16S rRNA (cytosine(967)-C(5))-methyltransferase RsmB n=1 Tax=Metabacillus kandeliae TaxID=2900151 RepID=UPI001E63D2D6|nr:16S rRNA (cytosine(967)-C(5))-methyltransferase RsmB [Metabacillus kandeliae]MCD7033830.1 16S rRNA (cytosine(967)-C(5))-methyltransferase RsmB [Metabacillus kandeliae]